MEAPTPRQLQILRAIVEPIASGEPWPTIRELCERFGISSTNAMKDHLACLTRKGLIEPDIASARSLRPTAAGWRAVGLRKPSPQPIQGGTTP